MANLSRFRAVLGISALLFVFGLFLGCAGTTPSETSGEEAMPVATESDETPAPLYYDFDDVLIPSELKVDMGRSFVYQTDEFTAGVLVLTGRVEINSLIRFFDNNMSKDNWRLVSAFKSPRTIMFFTKPNRSCIINITEKPYRLEAEIWVAPTTDTAQESLLK